ncbi:MAG: menaquinone reductase molybdopterin-binding-like subunit QrcB [Thermodesulfobacteriota bacterium]
MKIDRRSFLSLAAGVAAGTALTPLPLKLTDDLSIWTQTFRYMPNEVPVPPDGAVSVATSVCSLCPGGCGISVRKIDNRAVKIEGRQGYPVNNGGICTLGLAGLQLLYGPWRVQEPLKKKEGGFEKISWDQALSEISGRLNDLRRNGKSPSVAAITGAGQNTTGRLLQRFLTVFGSPHFIRIPAVDDSLAFAAGRMLGTAGVPAFDFENSSYVLSFGSGLLDGWGSPVRMFQAHSRWKENGATLVQVEARLSNTAAKADVWVPVKPGTEATLALGLAHVIVRDGLHDPAIEAAGKAFDAFRELLKSRYAPGAVARQTGVEEPKIEKLARDFARSPRPVAVCGKGAGQDPVESLEAMAVLALNALAGGFNRSGGVRINAAPDYIHWPEPEGSAAQKSNGTRLDVHRLPELINGGAQPPVQALFVMEANPLFTLHGAPALAGAVDKIPLVVSLSSYMDETAAAADYVLPVHAYLERYEDVLITAGLKEPLVGLSRPVVKPKFGSRHAGDVLIDLARAMGDDVAAAFPWENFEDCLKQTMADKWDVLSDQGYLAETGPEIPAGGMNFAALVESAELQPPGQGENGAWPLTLIPYDSMRLWGGHIGTPPFVLKTVADTVLKQADVFVEVNPVTAERYHLADGRPAFLETPAGKARVRVHVTDGIAPDVIAMPRGLGHAAYDDYLAEKGVNINALIGPVEDPVSGLDVAWGVKAKLTTA